MASILATWRAWAPHFLSLLRLLAGLLLLEFGTMKILHFPYSDYFAKIPQGCSADPTAPVPIQLGANCTISLIWIAGLLELVGGALVAVGLFTRFVAFILSGEMAFAYWMYHAPQGFYPALNEGLAAVLFCFTFLYISAAGGGPWSLDRIVRRVG